MIGQNSNVNSENGVKLSERNKILSRKPGECRQTKKQL